MLIDKEKIRYYLFYLLIIVEIIIVVIIGFKRHANIVFQNEPFYSLSNDWHYVDAVGSERSTNLPAKLATGQDNQITIYRQLPIDVYHLNTLSILTTHQSIKVNLGTRLIYSRMSEDSHSFFDLPTDSIWDIIELPPESAGKLIVITISSPYADYAGNINAINAGSKSALLLHSISTYGLRLLLAIITLFLGVFFIIIYLFLKRLIKINRSILFLGWFTILCSIWLIMESNLTQIFIANEYIISALTYLSLMSFPIPILIYITLIDNFQHKKLLSAITYIFIFSAFFLITLQFFNILDFHESTFIIRSEMFLLFGIVIITLLIELYEFKNKEIKVFALSSLILFLFGMVEILTYHFRSGNIGVIFQIGYIIFISILSWDAIRKVADIIKLSETAQHYKSLATKDLLTGCRNRVAYARDMDRVTLDRKITILVADMDNMKQINDTYGHHTGDEAIILCSQCLQNAFGRRVYRIGGDEFVMIQYDMNQLQIESLIEKFHKECIKANKDNPYPFIMSIGYTFYDKNIDETIYDTIDRADKNMYKEKHHLKDDEVDNAEE